MESPLLWPPDESVGAKVVPREGTGRGDACHLVHADSQPNDEEESDQELFREALKLLLLETGNALYSDTGRLARNRSQA